VGGDIQAISELPRHARTIIAVNGGPIPPPFEPSGEMIGNDPFHGRRYLRFVFESAHG